MTTTADEIARVAAQMQSAKVAAGTFAGVRGGQARVLFDGQEAVVPVAAEAWPEIGEQVHVISLDGKWLMIGPTVPKPEWGVVRAVTSTHASVEVEGKTVQLLRPAGVSVSVGQTVLIKWGKNGVIVAAYGDVPPSAEPIAPVGGGGTGSALFHAEWSGTGFSNGFWHTNSDIFTRARGSGSARGAWWYGDISKTVPAGAVITAARIYLPTLQPGSTHQIGWHSSPAKSGFPAMEAAENIVPPGAAGYVAISTGLAAVVAAAPRGLVVSGGAGSQYAGKDKDALSGALEIHWRF